MRLPDASTVHRPEDGPLFSEKRMECSCYRPLKPSEQDTELNALENPYWSPSWT